MKVSNSFSKRCSFPEVNFLLGIISLCSYFSFRIQNSKTHCWCGFRITLPRLEKDSVLVKSWKSQYLFEPWEFFFLVCNHNCNLLLCFSCLNLPKHGTQDVNCHHVLCTSNCPFRPLVFYFLDLKLRIIVHVIQAATRFPPKCNWQSSLRMFCHSMAG